MDEETCTPPQITFLNKYLNRARVAHINVANYLTSGTTPPFRALAWNVVGGPHSHDATLIAESVFAGGLDTSQTPYSIIEGLASWKGPVPLAETLDSPNGLIVYCRADRLGRPKSGTQTFDGASRTLYPVRLPPCPNVNPTGLFNAAVLIHYVKDQPDRVTFCGWFLKKAMYEETTEKLWNTQLSINGLRDLASTRYVTGNGDFSIEAWRIERSNLLRRSRGLPDIDVSVGFDTFLTSVLAHTSAGGLKGTTGGVGQENTGKALPPVDSWGVNQAVDVLERPTKNLPYMLINAIVSSTFSGFSIGDGGNYEARVYPWYKNCNFMVDFLPFEHQACAAGGLSRRSI